MWLERSNGGYGGGGVDARTLELLTSVRNDVDRRPAMASHAGPIAGLTGALSGLTADETCRVAGYCAARDVVSAAVRLNLL